jgi:hypothetical protein
MTRTETIATAIINARRMNRGLPPEPFALLKATAIERQQYTSEAEWVERKLAEFDAAERERNDDGYFGP